ncbi:host cell division inhibitor Icd-like protein, partial [Hafnia alvei]|uniref:host cell division inhibitor Icd-like protein n=1 Tax=Hafnia alvei TaxID=569 RepID=UPI002DBD3458
MVNATPCTHPKFIWRFYSCQKHRFYTVSARSEKEARDQLPDAPCVFTARFQSTAIATL